MQLKLYSHQEQALNDTESFGSCAYYLDMGLGKTFVGAEKLNRINNSLNLVICQKSKITDWMEHFERFYDFEMFNLCNKNELEQFLEHMPEQHKRRIGFINYELAWRRKQLLDLKGFTMLLDESSLIQNQKAKQTKFILKMNASNVILLSGTPSAGKYENLWSQIHLLGWDISEHAYNNGYVNWKTIDCNGFKHRIVDKIQPYKRVDRLKRKLREHGAVFMKTEEAFDLPEQNFIKIRVDASKEYKYFDKNKYIQLDDGTELMGDTILTERLCKRQLCGMYSEEKLDAFKDLIESTKERLIVFYNFNHELERLLEVIGDRPVSIVNGETKDLEAYETCDDSITLIQYQAGAMGLNLQKSNKIIYFTIPDKSELFEQSKKRIHRIGQKQPCFYYLMLVKNSIETKEILPTLKVRKDYTDELFSEEV